MLNNIFIRLFIVLTLFFSLACASKKNSEQLMYSSLSSIYSELGDSVFKNEIAQKEKMLLKDSAQIFSNNAHAKLLLQLVVLYSHKDNPNLDLSMARKYLKQYALLKDQVNVEYVQALLGDMVENKLKYDILNTKYDKLIKKKKKLEGSNSKLILKMRSKNKIIQDQKRIIQRNKEEIKKKNEIIEKIKVLDIQLENRRIDTD